VHVTELSGARSLAQLVQKAAHRLAIGVFSGRRAHVFHHTAIVAVGDDELRGSEEAIGNAQLIFTRETPDRRARTRSKLQKHSLGWAGEGRQSGSRDHVQPGQCSASAAPFAAAPFSAPLWAEPESPISTVGKPAAIDPP